MYTQRQQRRRIVEMSSALSRLRKLGSLVASTTTEEKGSSGASVAIHLRQDRAHVWLVKQLDMLTSIDLALMELSAALNMERACDTSAGATTPSLTSWAHVVDRAQISVAAALRDTQSAMKRLACTKQMDEPLLCTRATLRMMRATFDCLRDVRSELSVPSNDSVALWRCSALLDLLDRAAAERAAFEIECSAATHEEEKRGVGS